MTQFEYLIVVRATERMSEVSWEANRSPDQPTSSDQKSTNSPKQSLEGSERAEDNSPNRIRKAAV